MDSGSYKRKSKRSFIQQGLILLLLLLCLAFCLSGCGENTAQSSSVKTPTGTSTLRVGVRPRIYGFGYLNENTGKFYGLEIDIAQEMAERMGYTSTEFEAVTPENRLEMLSSGSIDCVVACYSITEEQEEFVDFSPAYYKDASIVMVENSSLFKNIEDLMGHGYTFGAIQGANTTDQLIERLMEYGLTSGEILETSEDGSVDTYDNFKVAHYEYYQDMDEHLEEGTIDAFCADGCIAASYLFDDRNILDFTISTQDYGAATLKGSVLSRPVADTVQAMLDDGTVAELIDKWD